LKKFPESGDNHIQDAFRSLGKSLDHQMIPVPVHDEGGDAVGFSINQAIGIGAGDRPLAILVGFLDPSCPKQRIDFFRVSGEEAESDLGAVAVEALGKKPPLLGF